MMLQYFCHIFLVFQLCCSKASDKFIYLKSQKVLADQQLKKLEELIGSPEIQIVPATGEKLDCPLAEIFGISNVVVLTAQVLLNGLTEGSDNVDIKTLTLIIFDECHNCQVSITMTE